MLPLVQVTDLQLEETDLIEPRNESTQRGFSRARETDEQEMALWLSKDSIDAQHLIEDLIEENQLNADLLLVVRLFKGKGQDRIGSERESERLPTFNLP